MKTFHCDKCGQQVFFENVLCERCGSMLGYSPEQGEVNSFDPAGENLWRSLEPKHAGRLYRKCRNYAQENACNWMIEADSTQELCASCQLTRMIPNLQKKQNHLYWQRLESAKRRLLYSLWQLGLQPSPKQHEAKTGLAFEFLEDLPDHRVMTGHNDGLITINIAEADPARRERTREQMHEPYRTLLGHFRHESGHYYFDRLIAGSPWEENFRALFGDERQDYGERLDQHYKNGPPPDWSERFISAYASSHPWEDWAETWSHYLHLFDTLDTARHCGMMLKPRTAGEPELTIKRHPLNEESFDGIMSDWFALTYVLNNLNRSIGMPDAYPFTLSTPVLQKLRFVHDVVGERAQRKEEG